jgi:DnaJ-class molecular chaperone
MDILLAVQKVEERFDYEGNAVSTEAWITIRSFVAEALKPSHNTQSKPCTTCGGKGMSVVWTFCPECGSRFPL